jgi:hypothetical protein
MVIELAGFVLAADHLVLEVKSSTKQKGDDNSSESSHFSSLCSCENSQYCENEGSKRQPAYYQTEFCLNKKLAMALILCLQVLWKNLWKRNRGIERP